MALSEFDPLIRAHLLNCQSAFLRPHPPLGVPFTDTQKLGIANLQNTAGLETKGEEQSNFTLCGGESQYLNIAKSKLF